MQKRFSGPFLAIGLLSALIAAIVSVANGFPFDFLGEFGGNDTDHQNCADGICTDGGTDGGPTWQACPNGLTCSVFDSAGVCMMTTCPTGTFQLQGGACGQLGCEGGCGQCVGASSMAGFSSAAGGAFSAAENSSGGGQTSSAQAASSVALSSAQASSPRSSARSSSPGTCPPDDPRITQATATFGVQPVLADNGLGQTLVYWDVERGRTQTFQLFDQLGLLHLQPTNYTDAALEGLVQSLVGTEAAQYRYVLIEGMCDAPTLQSYLSAGHRLSKDRDCNDPILQHKINYIALTSAQDGTYVDPLGQTVTIHIGDRMDGPGDGGQEGHVAAICPPPSSGGGSAGSTAGASSAGSLSSGLCSEYCTKQDTCAARGGSCVILDDVRCDVSAPPSCENSCVYPCGNAASSGRSSTAGAASSTAGASASSRHSSPSASSAPLHSSSRSTASMRSSARSSAAIVSSVRPASSTRPSSTRSLGASSSRRTSASSRSNTAPSSVTSAASSDKSGLNSSAATSRTSSAGGAVSASSATGGGFSSSAGIGRQSSGAARSISTLVLILTPASESSSSQPVVESATFVSLPCSSDVQCVEGVCVDGFCRSACGNGRVDPGEACDDGERNGQPGASCSLSCRRVDGQTCTADPLCQHGRCLEQVCVSCAADKECRSGKCLVGTCVDLCGNGRVDPGEACDDGNRVDGDDCANVCLLGGGHTCETGLQCAGGRCGANRCGGCTSDEQCRSGVCREGICQSTCGNGRLDPGEACDDGNFVTGDGCSAFCTREKGAAPALQADLVYGSVTGFDTVAPAPFPAPREIPSITSSATTHAIAGKTGPEMAVLLLAGAAGGWTWMRRRRRKRA